MGKSDGDPGHSPWHGGAVGGDIREISSEAPRRDRVKWERTMVYGGLGCVWTDMKKGEKWG
jgi:hypothetical protein